MAISVKFCYGFYVFYTRDIIEVGMSFFVLN